MSSLDNLTSAANDNAQIARDLSVVVDRAIIALDAGGTNNEARLVAVTATVAASTAAIKVERDRLSVAVDNDGNGGPIAVPPTEPAPGAPVISSPLSASGAAGAPFRFALMASGNPTQYSASALPAGLSLNTRTGVISGTPTDDGSTNVSVLIGNSRGATRATMGFLIR